MQISATAPEVNKKLLASAEIEITIPRGIMSHKGKETMSPAMRASDDTDTAASEQGANLPPDIHPLSTVNKATVDKSAQAAGEQQQQPVEGVVKPAPVPLLSSHAGEITSAAAAHRDAQPEPPAVQEQSDRAMLQHVQSGSGPNANDSDLDSRGSQGTWGSFDAGPMLPSHQSSEDPLNLDRSSGTAAAIGNSADTSIQARPRCMCLAACCIGYSRQVRVSTRVDP